MRSRWSALSLATASILLVRSTLEIRLTTTTTVYIPATLTSRISSSFVEKSSPGSTARQSAA